MVRGDNKSEAVLIDFEFAELGHRGCDIGAYFNECQIDYSHPAPPFYRLYPEMELSDKELKKVIDSYLKTYYTEVEKKGEEGLQEYIDVEYPLMLDQVKRAIVLYSLIWVFFCMVDAPLLKDDPYKGRFYVTFCKERFETYKRYKEKWF